MSAADHTADTSPAATDTAASNTDTNNTTAPRAAGPSAGRLRSALTRYRVLSYVTGVWLLLLCAEMVYKYLLLADSSTAPHWLFYIGQIHGLFYMLYLVFTIDLAIKTRWKPVTTVVGAYPTSCTQAVASRSLPSSPSSRPMTRAFWATATTWDQRRGKAAARRFRAHASASDGPSNIP